MEPRVTVLTATYNRHDLLLDRCIPSVQAQTIPVKHLIIDDRPDLTLFDRLPSGTFYMQSADIDVAHPPRTSSTALNLGMRSADTEFIAVCDDDNALRPYHCEKLVQALDAKPEAEFAYSKIERHGIGDVVGWDPPNFGLIDGNSLMWRRETPWLCCGWWPVDTMFDSDWQLINTWLQAGATYAHVPEVTVDYYWSNRSWTATGGR